MTPHLLPPTEFERQARLHRYRFLLPLCHGRIVADVGPRDAAGLDVLVTAARRVLTDPPAGAADVAMWLAPLRGSELAAMLPGLRRPLSPSGVLAVAVADGAPLAESALAAVFKHIAIFRQRPLAGTLIGESVLFGARVVALADPPTDPGQTVTLLLGSDAALPPLPTGVFENVALPSFLTWAAAALSAPAPPLVPPLDQPPLVPGLADLRRQAVGLVDRLAELDDRIIDLTASVARLHAQLERQRTAGDDTAALSDIPRTSHAWPAADAPDRDPSDFAHYEHRPDDAVIAAGRAGDDFLRRHALLTDRPDYDGALAELNTSPPRLVPPSDAQEAPDASIIIPVYGQLGYTLNCLHSLLGHVARYSAEILVWDDCSPDETADVLACVRGLQWQRNARNLGFLRSCNAAVATARGRIVVLLNNDTRVLPGWLDALIDSFAAFPRAGLVGSKLLYSDGTLQEAGAIIWRDGSAWNYGRTDDPNRPHYSHARRVDYVSAASVAVPTAVWRELGGFDEMFAPAYCEDADLCLRLRQMGHEVWYQPLSKVIHYEGRTSGTDTTTGVKAYQRINSAKLFLRWRDALVDHRPNGQAPYFERERHVRRRALIVDATTPTPQQDAGSVTTMLTLRLFDELGYKPYFVPQDNFLFDPKHTPALQAMGVECAYMPYEPDFTTYIRRYGALFDAVLVYRMPVMEQVLADLRRFAPQAPVLFHVMDLHSLRLRRQAEVEGTETAHEAVATMRAQELALIRRVDCTITHSTFERDLLAREAPEAPTVVWPFMFEFFGTDVGFAARRDFIFLGGYRHAPNVDAVQFFVREVLPLIHAEEPTARFIIAGANPGPEVQALAGPHVVVTGLVEDLQTVFDAARVFVCPLRFGAGTKGKISTAMSYGLPVVTTSCGAEGMELQEGREVLLADTPADFAAACLRLYRDGALWQRLSLAGQDLVREKHSPAMGRRVLAEAIDLALRHRLGIDAGGQEPERR